MSHLTRYPIIKHWSEVELDGKRGVCLYNQPIAGISLLFDLTVPNVKSFDWNGNESNGHRLTIGALGYSKVLSYLGQSIGLDKFQVFFTDSLEIWDIKISLNKFVGPNMISELFAKCAPVVMPISDPVMWSTVPDICGNKFISKPLIYDYYQLGDEFIPKYGLVGDWVEREINVWPEVSQTL